MPLLHNLMKIPSSQGDLIRAVRANRTQAEFALALGVDRSCLSRYESEALGAPTSVINHCLAEIARTMNGVAAETSPIAQALVHAHEVVGVLERIQGKSATEPTKTSKAKRSDK